MYPCRNPLICGVRQHRDASNCRVSETTLAENLHRRSIAVVNGHAPLDYPRTPLTPQQVERLVKTAGESAGTGDAYVHQYGDRMVTYCPVDTKSELHSELAQRPGISPKNELIVFSSNHEGLLNGRDTLVLACKHVRDDPDDMGVSYDPVLLDDQGQHYELSSDNEEFAPQIAMLKDFVMDGCYIYEDDFDGYPEVS